MNKTFLLVAAVAIGILALCTVAYAEGGGTGDGILYVTSEYDTIQEAINNADDGDTIIVDPSLYDENLVINVKVSIEGAGSGNDSLQDTIIDPSGGLYGMYIHQSVNLKDLRVINAASHGIRVQTLSGRLDFSNVTWENIAIADNGGRGVEIHNGTDVSNMTITNCEIVDNIAQGIRSASDVTIDGLNITGCKLDRNQYGLYLQGSVKNVLISQTTIDDNLFYGIYASETGPIKDIAIEDSTLNGNSYWGLLLWTPSAKGITNLSIVRTSIDNNGLGAWIGASVISNVTIETSSIVNNTSGNPDYYEGIEFAYGTLTDIVVKYTNIYGNLGEGIANYGTGIVDARYNWWGHASGPSGEDGRVSNNGKVIGKGDAVTGDVAFDPWLPQAVWHTPHHPVPPAFQK